MLLITQHSIFSWQENYQNTRRTVIYEHDSIWEEVMLKIRIRFFYLCRCGSLFEELYLDVIFKPF